MRIIEILAQKNGAHRNQTGAFEVVPPGWAIIPDGLAIPASFPFVDLKVKEGIVTSITTNEAHYAKAEEARAKTESKNTISELKRLLTDTDYKAIKYAEGLISEAEYAPIKAERQAWRDEINALEAELEGGT